MSFERNTLITGISWFSLQYLLVNLKILCFCRRYADMSRSEEPISTEGTKCSNCLAKSLKSRLSYWKDMKKFCIDFSQGQLDLTDWA